jgi:hypothetical protein
MVNAADTHRWNFRTDTDGVQWVCKGLHDRSTDCEWELASAHLAPKNNPVEECIEYLRSHGDYFGVGLLQTMQDVNRGSRKEDPENPERAREEEG